VIVAAPATQKEEGGPTNTRVSDARRRRRVGILHLDPIGAAARPIGPVAALSDDALRAEPARVAKHRRAVRAVEMFR